MKSAIIRFFGTLIVAAALGTAVTGCDMPEEKKSLFQRAVTTEPDSARGREQKSDADEKKDQKKPQAFRKIERVEV